MKTLIRMIFQNRNEFLFSFVVLNIESTSKTLILLLSNDQQEIATATNLQSLIQNTYVATNVRNDFIKIVLEKQRSNQKVNLNAIIVLREFRKKDKGKMKKKKTFVCKRRILRRRVKLRQRNKKWRQKLIIMLEVEQEKSES